MLKRLHRSERGQLLVMMVLFLTVIFIVGSVAVDLSLWLSERRGAQKDADLSAIAAAQPLLALLKTSDLGAAALEQQANDRAADYLTRNGVKDLSNAHTPVPDDNTDDQWTSCWADQDGGSDLIDTYPLDVEHPSRSLFSRIFGFVSPSGLGAHARACVGSIITAKGVMPVGVPINNPDFTRWSRELCWGPDGTGGIEDGLPDPLYGKRCDLSVTDKLSGEASWLALDNSSPLPDPPTAWCHNSSNSGRDLTDEIAAGGANTICRIAPAASPPCPTTSGTLPQSAPNYCVKSKTGAPTNTIMNAFQTLFSTEGNCDGTGDGIDDFASSVQLESGTPETPSAFYKVICDSPRLVTLIIVDNFDPSGNVSMKIRAFASFFVEACTNDKTGTVIEYPKCDPRGEIGQFNLVGRFVNILGEGAVGAPTDYSPKRIVLDQ